MTDSEIKSALLRQTSHSSFDIWQECERKYELYKYTDSEKESTVDTAFGHAVGAGIQMLFTSSGNIERAAAATFLNWTTDFKSEKATGKKNIAYAWKAVKAFVPFYNLVKTEWHIALINGVPAVEFSLLLLLPGGFRYRAYADILLQHNRTGVYAVVEVKSTGATWQHEAQYKNQGQAVSYSTILDKLQEFNSYLWVKYFAYYTGSEEWVPYDFPKGIVEKARWLRTLLRDIKDIARAEEDNYFPMRGKSCMSFGRPCDYFDVCSLQSEQMLATPLQLRKKLEKELKREYQFVVNVEDILTTYLTEN